MFYGFNNQSVVGRFTLRLLGGAISATVLFATLFQADVSAAQKKSFMAPLAAQSLLLDGTAVGVLSVVGERGHLLLSKDNGEAWTQVQLPTRATLTGIFFLDDKYGWIVGHEETILRTVDGGLNWEVVNHNPEKEDMPLFAVRFKDADNGFAIGAYGTLLVTSDGGQTWDFQDFTPDADANTDSADNGSLADDEYSDEYEEDLPFDYHLNHISSADNGRFYIAAEAGNFFRSDDNGETWKTIELPYFGSFFGSLPLDGDGVLAYGLRGNLFRSDDAGESWIQIETGVQSMLTAACRLSDDTVVVVGLGGTVLVSADEGRTFASRNLVDRQDITGLFESDDKALIMTGAFGVKKFPLSALAE